ncbi:MAG: hypothetical protein BA866_02130 [Desulfobulbaceae bacterium S5133MH15]|nr:MAG: hypothetical protein BA866_02130 [Desulfobulbaceae bacterium S5133MH15]
MCQLLCWFYELITRSLGYWDRTDCSIIKETKEILLEQFKEVQEAVSGSGKQLVIARNPQQHPILPILVDFP